MTIINRISPEIWKALGVFHGVTERVIENDYFNISQAQESLIEWEGKI